MRHLLILLISFSSQSAFACEVLVGTWKSSKKLSMDYNNAYADLQEKQAELLNQILGFMEISYTENEIYEHQLPKVKVSVGGENHDFIFAESKYDYSVVSCDENKATLKYDHPFAGQSEVNLVFLSKDIYWASSEMMPNGREYFIRVSK